MLGGRANCASSIRQRRKANSIGALLVILKFKQTWYCESNRNVVKALTSDGIMAAFHFGIVHVLTTAGISGARQADASLPSPAKHRRVGD